MSDIEQPDIEQPWTPWIPTSTPENDPYWAESNSPRRLHRWWRYAVLRGAGIPAELDGRWYDLDEMPPGSVIDDRFGGAILHPTNRWEQRDNGEVAVVYEWLGVDEYVQRNL